MMADLPILGGLAFGLLVAKTTLVLLATWLVTVIARRRSAADRHFVWLVGMMGAVLLPVLAVTPWRWNVQFPAISTASFLADSPEIGPTLSQFGTETDSHDAPVFQGSSALPATIPDEGDVLPVPSITISVGGSETRDVAEAAAAPGPQPVLVNALMPAGRPAAPVSPWVLLLTWAGVGAALIARTLAGHFQAFRHGRRAETIQSPDLVSLCRRIECELGASSVRILAGSLNEMPKAAGFLRPWLVLPADVADWPRSRQESVLRHEIAHVRRRDTLWEGLVRIACAVNWFNPLVWFAAAKLRAEREHACDDIVLLSGTAPSDYATDLLSVARQFRSGGYAASAAIAMAKPSRLRLRLTAVLDDRRRTTLTFGERGGLIAAAGLSLLLMVGIASPVAAGQEAVAEVNLTEVPPEIVRPSAGSGSRSSPATPEAPPISTIETIETIDTIIADQDAESGSAGQAAVGDVEAWFSASYRPDLEKLLADERRLGQAAQLERSFALALQVTYGVTARLTRSTEPAPMVPARIVAALRGTTFLQQMSVGWGGSTGQAQTLSASFTFSDAAALEAWQASEAGRAFHAAVDDAAVAGTVRFSISTQPVH